MVSTMLALAVICGFSAAVVAVRIARALEPHGVRTPFPFIGLLVFRNLHRYREITLSQTGRVGPLFYAYVVPINMALALVLAAWALHSLGR
jgi:hypothetical protein